MNHLSHSLNAGLKLAGVFAIVCVGLFFLQARKAAISLQTTSYDISVATQEATAAVADIHGQLIRKGGLLDIAQKTMLHVDRASGEAAIASRQQRVAWDQASARLVALLDDADLTIKGLDTTQAQIASDAHDSLQRLNASLDGLPPLLKSGQDAIDAVGAVANGPDIRAGIKSTADAAENIAESTGSASRILATVDVKVDKLAHPSTLQRTFDAFLTTLRAASSLGWLFK